MLLALLGILLIWFADQKRQLKDRKMSRAYWTEELLRENEKYCAKNARKQEASARKEKQTDQELTDQEQTDQEIKIQAGQNEEMIKVLLTDGSGGGYYYQQVEVELAQPCFVNGTAESNLSSKERMYLSGETGDFKDGMLSIHPQKEGYTIQKLILNGKEKPSSYRGEFCIYRDENGIRVVNILPVEEYLYQVVPSEMPSSYESEALKAQAVCARTYAYVQKKSRKLEGLGADVDDTVAFQVYANSKESEKTNQAVNETKDEILTQNGSPVNAYYFSTSSGKTSTDAVWEASAPSSYLQSVSCTYDEKEPWYRWNVYLSAEHILENLQKEYGSSSKIRKIEIEEDGVPFLKIITDKGCFEVKNEYDIRTILAPCGAAITRQDGSQVKGGNLLPSAYFSLTPEYENEKLTGVQIDGGGYGHGVGMSQNGAQNMALQKMEYEAILKYFYKDVEISDENVVQ